MYSGAPDNRGILVNLLQAKQIFFGWNHSFPPPLPFKKSCFAVCNWGITIFPGLCGSLANFFLLTDDGFFCPPLCHSGGVGPMKIVFFCYTVQVDLFLPKKRSFEFWRSEKSLKSFLDLKMITHKMIPFKHKEFKNWNRQGQYTPIWFPEPAWSETFENQQKGVHLNMKTSTKNTYMPPLILAF